MSGRDLAFIQSLRISGSEVARILEISRQSVSRGLRSHKDYLDRGKLHRISEAVPKLFDIDSRYVAKLITKFYPDFVDDIRKSAAAAQANIGIDSEFYFCCNKLPYYMSVYKRSFAHLAAYVRECKQQKSYFAFSDADLVRYSRKIILNWLDDPRVAANASVVVFPTIEVLPFSICGYEGAKPAIYFCDREGFVRQNEINSKCILNIVKDYIDQNPGRIKPLKSSSG